MIDEPTPRCPGCGADTLDGNAFCASCGRSLEAVSISLEDNSPEPAREPTHRGSRGRKLLLVGAVAVAGVVGFSVLSDGGEPDEQAAPTTVPFIGEEAVDSALDSIVGTADEELLLRAGDGLHVIDLRTGRQRTVARGYADVEQIELRAFSQGVMSTEDRFVWGLDIENNVGLATILEAGSVVGARDAGTAWMLQEGEASTNAVLTFLNAWNAIEQLEVPNSATIVGAIGSDLVISTPSGTVLIGSGGGSALSSDRAFAVSEPYIAYEQCGDDLSCTVVVRDADGQDVWSSRLSATQGRALSVDRAALSPDGQHIAVDGSAGLELISHGPGGAALSVEMTNVVWTTDSDWIVGRSQDDRLIFVDPWSNETLELELDEFLSSDDLPLAEGRIHAFADSTGLFDGS